MDTTQNQKKKALKSMFGKLFRKTISTRTVATSLLTIDDINIEVNYKKVRNMTLRVKSKTRDVKVTAPVGISTIVIEQFVQSKISWIKQHLNKMTTPLEQLNYKNGEHHPFLGKHYPIQIHLASKNNVILKNNTLEIHTKEADSQYVKKILDEWYRYQLKQLLPPLFRKYEPLMQVKVKEFGIKSMKTRWGTCNPKAARIWINLEMAKKELSTLEYLVVHEMVHLLEPSHNQRFYRLMTRFLTNWKELRKELKSGTC